MAILSNVQAQKPKLDSIVEEQKMYEMTWQWKDGNNKVHTIRVTDTDFTNFQTKVNTAKGQYPPNV